MERIYTERKDRALSLLLRNDVALSTSNLKIRRVQGRVRLKRGGEGDASEREEIWGIEKTKKKTVSKSDEKEATRVDRKEKDGEGCEGEKTKCHSGEKRGEDETQHRQK